MRIITLLFAFSVASPALASGPFGFEPGTSLAVLSKQVKLEPVEEGVYSTTTAPKGHSAFEKYYLFVSPKAGLGKVVAIGFTINTSAYGNELRSKFEQIEEGLVSKYGAGEKYDYLRAGSIWNDDNDWMMSLLKKERVLRHFWDAEQGSRVADDTAGIILEARAMSPGEGYVNLTYEFKCFEQWIAERKAKENEAL